ncbi:interleukin 15, like [Notolabrus celidotus]|uniref:interleukin 15, like n=1 Tax=Notolabrus celidotus TaxID=1203425 RepID=UPI00149012D9|nr:interleukin 15, like [Notolabrus celidotus]
MMTGRRGLASACLCFLCLLALTQKLAAGNQIRGILRQVKTLIKKAPMRLLDCRLYTPHISDYKKCPRSTMQCFADEVKVLIEEWETLQGVRFFRLDRELENLAKKLNKTTPECLRCELLQEENAEEFLGHLEKTLQMISISGK